MNKPELFHRKFKKKDGTFTETKEWYFRVSINNTRKMVNTGTVNKLKAVSFMNRWLLGENLTSPITSPSINKMKMNETLPELMKRTGWLNPKTNPKYLTALADKKNYGLTQATKIADALNHMFVDIGDVNDFTTYLRLNKIIKINRIENYTEFVSKPFQQLTMTDASKFKNFIVEYADWLKMNKKVRYVPVDSKEVRKYNRELKKRNTEDKPPEIKVRLENKYFMCQSRINIVALKAFYSHSFKAGIVNENIFRNEYIPTTPELKIKDKFKPEQIQTLFNADFAKFISDKVAKGFSDTPLFKSFAFCAYTGMRSAEIRALRWKQISEDNRVLIIDSAFKLDSTNKSAIGLPKWDKVRKIILADCAVACLGERRKPDDFVFTLKGGGAIGSNKFINSFKVYVGWVESEIRRETREQGKEISFTGGKSFTPHSFRGTMNSLLLSRASLNESAIQEYFGWTKKNLTQVQAKHYTTFDTYSMWMVANEIEKIITGKPMTWKPAEEKSAVEYSDIVSSILKKNNMDDVDFNEELNKRVGTLGTYDYAEKYYPKG